MDNIKQTFELVYQETNQKVKLYLLKRCKDMADVNDILQDTYIEYYGVLEQKGDSYIKNSEALLMNIARKKTHKHYKKWNKVEKQISYDDEYQIEEQMEIDSYSIEDEVVTKELVRELYQKLMKKSGDIQKIFYLYYQMGLSLSEIAEVLEMKESTVKSKLYRTVKELRIDYEKEEQHEGKRIISAGIAENAC